MRIDLRDWIDLHFSFCPFYHAGLNDKFRPSFNCDAYWMFFGMEPSF